MTAARVPHDTPVRVLLVEDHPVVRLGLRTILAAQPDGFELDEAEEAATCLQLLERGPALVLMPLRLEGELKGVELCREIKSRDPDVAVLIYTAYASREDASTAYLSGADSFLYKGAPETRLLDAIRTTLAGGRVWALDRDERQRLATFERGVASSGLTAREAEVLGFMLQRYTNAEIARELYIEVPTVKSHVSSILQKLGISSRRELFMGESAG